MISKDYFTDAEGAHPIGGGSIPQSILDVLSAPLRKVILLLASGKKPKKGTEIKHQYCTALPIGTAIAQSWNTDLAEACGDIIGDEMGRFGVHLWLAPALNIHRSILCGRNFEYYSEDPLISGKIAAAITRGVQAHRGKGVTIKHFAANNCEYNRYYNNSAVSERALREIYLKGFRICIEEAGPHALMTSYNLINGIHSSESRPLTEGYLRAECGFEGIVMTDWVISVRNHGTMHEKADAARVAAAGGDLFMPGYQDDYDSVMDALARKMGSEAFREGLREYLRTYAYSNADWDDLVAILDRKAGFDVKAWSDRWIKEAGMPEACFSGRSPGQLFPDTDGVVYGCFLMDEDDAEYCYRLYSSLDEEERMGVLMNLYENVWRRRIDASRFTDWAASAIYKETNPLIFGSLLDYADSALLYSGRRQPIYEHSLCAIAADPSRPHEMRLQAFRAFSKIAASPKDCRLLYDIWRNRKPFPDLVLGEKDYTDLSFQLMLRYPERFEEIGLVQRSRISNPDRLQAFDFVSEAAAPEKSRRAAFFNSLMQAQNRRPESRVLTAIDLLCSPLRGSEAAEYIFPALEILPEIQRTGDIFFPASWCRRFLGSQISAQAKQEVEAFLAASESMHPLLRTKILQAAGWLLQ